MYNSVLNTVIMGKPSFYGNDKGGKTHTITSDFISIENSSRYRFVIPESHF